MGKILIVDDEPEIGRVYSLLLTHAGHETRFAESREALLQALHPWKPDLILMDLAFPKESGLTLLKLTHLQEGPIPVVIFSGLITPEIEKEAFQWGALDVLAKGLSNAEFLKQIEKYLTWIGKQEERERVRKKSILIVDDESGIRQLLKGFFVKHGYEVSEASRGEDAVRIVAETEPAVVLLDLKMPGMDGLETLKKILEIRPDTGVVMATGSQDDEAARTAIRLGAFAYVLKPFDFPYLELVVLARIQMAS